MTSVFPTHAENVGGVKREVAATFHTELF